MVQLLEQVCLPLPQRMQLSGEVVPCEPTRFTWRGARPVGVEAYAEKMLGELELGEVSFRIQAEEMLPYLDMDEGYAVDRDGAVITVTSVTNWGSLRAIATLYQQASYQPLPAQISIADAPRFPWRGLLIDVARHFLSLDKLMQIVGGMALVKLNVLHLHLTDDQGFRFASTRYPRLASADHYSAEELKILTEYAASVGVRVIPELDVPGHVTSWLTAYPEWGSQAVDATDRFGVHKACLDVSNPEVIEAVESLFRELGEVFPDKYVHIGGDEVHPKWWAEDENMAAHAAAIGLDGVREVQNRFNHVLVEKLTRLGKCVVGWDEVLTDDMPSLVVQNWRGATTRDVALNRGMDCIVSAPYYLDLHFPADMHYAFDPADGQDDLVALENKQQQDLRLQHVAQGLGWTRQWRDDAEVYQPNESRILGGEACLWSELVDETVIDVRLWSRLPVIAERLWSAAEVTDVESMYRRLEQLTALPQFDLVSQQHAGLTKLGLNAQEQALACLLEPVKWYGRLLGEVALQARLAGQEMPQARPYDVHTPLNRLVDVIAPESLQANKLQSIVWSDWQRLAEHWVSVATPRLDAQAPESLAALRKLAGLLLSSGIHTSEEALVGCYGPHDGELMLAAVPALLAWRKKHTGTATDG